MKQEIEVEGLPEGWKLTRIKLPVSSTAHVNSSTISCHNFTGALFDLEKIKPRRIVLEETGEVRKPVIGDYIKNNENFCKCHKPERWGYEHEIWREVKEGDE